MDTPRPIPTDALADFCRRWKIKELSLFGSYLRVDFSPTSDVDVLVTFAADAPWDYWDWPDMQDELSGLFGQREIHLVEAKALVNPFRRHEIMATRRVVYAA